MPADPEPRRLLTAEILSIGTELTVGDTRDTNAGELARSLAAAGVAVQRLTALPDDLAAVTAAFTAGLERSDLVVSTGGLGPTPDDLTREAIAATIGEMVEVDPVLERWLRRLWARRSMPFPEINLKQAWLIPSAEALANPNGTAPGWFVSRPDGRVVVALPGPPREMRPMWHDHALPRLQARGLGADVAVVTYRLAGIGESQVADLLGEPLLRATNPIVATYARAEAVDVRVSAIATATATAADLVEPAAAIVRERLDRLYLGHGRHDLGDGHRETPRRARLDHRRRRGGLGWPGRRALRGRAVDPPLDVARRSLRTPRRTQRTTTPGCWPSPTTPGPPLGRPSASPSTCWTRVTTRSPRSPWSRRLVRSSSGGPSSSAVRTAASGPRWRPRPSC